MIVMSLENCPLALRGDLTKWLLEISPGVYVGQISARVRDNLWKRVCDECQNGRATMVYSARNEQHLEFRVHNAPWEPIDFDGVRLMLHPNASYVRDSGKRRSGFSDASNWDSTRRSTRNQSNSIPSTYVVLDIETTGTDIDKDEIVEICALKIEHGIESDCLCSFVRGARFLPKHVEKLTGITIQDLEEGKELADLLDQLLDFIEDYPLVMHNAPFDMRLLENALEECGFDELENQSVDTLAMARRRLPKAPSYRLGDLCDSLGIEHVGLHRARPDCIATNLLFKALMRMQ